MRPELENIKKMLIEVLQEYVSLEDVPPALIKEAIRELTCTRTPPTREVITKYVQSVLLPELNRKLLDRLNVFRRSYGWGQIKKVLPYILSDYLESTGYTVYVRPIVSATRVDVVVERYGKYLPLVISTGSKEKLARYKVSRLRARGINAEIITLSREKIIHEKGSLVDINLIDYLLSERGHEAPNFIVDRYEQTLFTLWRDFIKRGYIVFKNYIYENYVFDLLAVGYSIIGVKKLTRSLIQSEELLTRNFKELRRLLRRGLIDKVKLVVLEENLDLLNSKVNRYFTPRETELMSIVLA